MEGRQNKKMKIQNTEQFYFSGGAKILGEALP